MDKEFESYYLGKTWKRITARIIDILFVSLIPAVMTLIWFLIDKTSVNSWKSLLVMMIFNYLLLVAYFIFLPWKANGQTLGKKIFGIKLVHEEKVHLSLKYLFLRESILVFIPLTLAMIAILLTSIFLQKNIATIDEKYQTEFWISVLVRIIYSFIFAWYLGIMIVVKIDKKHQLFYDRKYHLYVVSKKSLLKKPSSQTMKEKKNELIHIHLGRKQPGNISEDELKEIQDL